MLYLWRSTTLFTWLNQIGHGKSHQNSRLATSSMKSLPNSKSLEIRFPSGRQYLRLATSSMKSLPNSNSQEIRFASGRQYFRPATSSMNFLPNVKSWEFRFSSDRHSWDRQWIYQSMGFSVFHHFVSDLVKISLWKYFEKKMTMWRHARIFFASPSPTLELD